MKSKSSVPFAILNISNVRTSGSGSGPAVLKCWRDHFSNLALSQHNEHRPAGVDLSALHTRSFCFDDQVLDTLFSIEEVECVIRKLKSGKSGGTDGLQPEYIKFGGPAINSWILRIFNAIKNLEDIPPSLKLGVTIPVFKGKAHDPSNTNSYRGITLTSVIAKCLEIAILYGLSSRLDELSIPHHAQMAY